MTLLPIGILDHQAHKKNQMLDYLGFDNLDKLIDEIVPDVIRRKEPMNIADGMSELAALKQPRNLARMNIRYKSFIGQGYYNSITPPSFSEMLKKIQLGTLLIRPISLRFLKAVLRH